MKRGQDRDIGNRLKRLEALSTSRYEISICWKDVSKAPFEGRIQKLESVLASSASAYFNYEIFGTEKYPELRKKAEKYIPVFDCGVFNVPSMEELANGFLWREKMPF